jgi:hypothetical protein
MNLSFYTVALLASTLSFSNPFYPTNSKDTTILVTPSDKTAAFATDWESVPNWKQDKQVDQLYYTYNRSTPELNKTILEGGAVVVFAKGYDFEGFSRGPQKPLGLPFYMMTAAENVTQPYAWYSENSEGSIKVGLKMSPELESTFLKGSENIQFRYFVLPQNVLTQHKLNAQSLRSLSYSGLTQLLGVAP